MVNFLIKTILEIFYSVKIFIENFCIVRLKTLYIPASILFKTTCLFETTEYTIFISISMHFCTLNKFFYKTISVF